MERSYFFPFPFVIVFLITLMLFLSCFIPTVVFSPTSNFFFAFIFMPLWKLYFMLSICPPYFCCAFGVFPSNLGFLPSLLTVNWFLSSTSCFSTAPWQETETGSTCNLLGQLFHGPCPSSLPHLVLLFILHQQCHTKGSWCSLVSSSLALWLFRLLSCSKQFLLPRPH